MPNVRNFNDLPKTGVIALKAGNVLDSCSLISAFFVGSKKCLIQHEAFKPWLADSLFGFNKDIEFFEFSNKQQIDITAVKSSSAEEVVFVDPEIHIELYGYNRTLRLLNVLKKEKKVIVLLTSETRMPHPLEWISIAVFTICTSADKERLEFSTMLYDKKGKAKTSGYELSSEKKSQIKLLQNSEPLVDGKEVFNKNEHEVTVKTEINLPFFSSRQDNGVALRDAATRKIRVGGQVVYEPDREDDFDDSDPDDDLNI